MAPIVTYVFLDIKTTGSPAEECNRTRITEISLIAAKRDHILHPQGNLPRVQQKLTLCLNPGKVIHPQYTKDTGLCNDILEFESSFNKDTCNTIKFFLSTLSKPVCLVAQEGLKFDFPILKNHLNNLGVSFTDDILCADYLQAFDDILKMKAIPSNGYVNNTTSEDLVVDEVDQYYLLKASTMQAVNETTPKKASFGNFVLKTPRKPVETIKILRRHSKPRRLCFWEEEPPVTIPKSKDPYKLKNIYNTLRNEPCIEAHRAENHCTIALQCSIAVARQFVHWVDINHRLFSEVKPMTIGVPLGE